MMKVNRRVDRLCERLHDNEAALISSYPNIFYYSGFTSGDAYLLISHDSRFIITDSRYTIQAREQAKDYEVIDIKNGFEKIFSKISADYIGYESKHMCVSENKRLKMKIANHQALVEKQKVIDEARSVKDSEEIRRISEAERIGDEAFSHVLGMIRAGAVERDIALELEFFMKRNGASALSFDTIVASGARSAMPHGVASGKTIEQGDLVTLDFGCIFEGYCSDMTRTVVVGKANDRQKEIYDVVLKAQTAAIDAVRVGAVCSDVDKVARDIISGAGYGGNFGHGLGHSVGIEIHESPSFAPRSNAKLENGNVITVEPGIYVDGFGGVRIEDLIVIEDGKARNLTHSPKELIEL